MSSYKCEIGYKVLGNERKAYEHCFGKTKDTTGQESIARAKENEE